MIKPSVCIQHHPARAHLLPALLERVPDAEVVTDPAAGTPGESPLSCQLECLRRTPEWATHRVVIQDDAILAHSFMQRMNEAIAEHPDALVPLFVPGSGIYRTTVHQARQAGRSWAQVWNPPMVPTVALAWPRAAALAFVAHMEERIREAPHRKWVGDDGYVGRWALRTRTPVWLPLPSMVQHPDVEPSLIGRKAQAGRNAARVAAWYDGA